MPYFLIDTVSKGDFCLPTFSNVQNIADLVEVTVDWGEFAEPFLLGSPKTEEEIEVLRELLTESNYHFREYGIPS